MRKFMHVFRRQPCSHTSRIRDPEQSAQDCEECLRTFL